jgi:hypothetical protein
VNTNGTREFAATGPAAQANTRDLHPFGRKRRENVISADYSPLANSFMIESRKLKTKSERRLVRRSTWR